jgi:hypothetical protein
MSNKSFENTFTDNDDFNIPKYDDDVSVSGNNNVSAVNNSKIDDADDYEETNGNQEKTELNTFKDSGDIASNLFNLYQDKHVYKDFGIELDLTRGLTDTMTSRLNAGKKNVSIVNKLHLIKLAGNYPAMETDIPKHSGFFEPKTVIDLCMMNRREDAVRYDLDDFVYCKNVGLPINRLITLRRFPFACTDNIFDRQQEWHDIARMVTYMTQETNKMEELLSFSYALRWKELTAEMEQASMFGDQSGVSGFIKNVANLFDKTLQSNAVSGRSTPGAPMNSYDPKFDQNRVYGPVDSISQTNIRDVGLEFNKDFEITFDYELRSINGRTAEYAFKDILANILACTYNNAKFWGGSRYWVGERPTNFMHKIAYMNSDDAYKIFHKAAGQIRGWLQDIFASKQSALATLKKIVNGAFALAMGKVLDSVGRPGILAMNSLLSSEPTGNWHLTIGNPFNPIMCVGNLIMTGVDFKFPTDSLSYGDFPTKMQVVVKLKPGQPKDRAGIEMMFNHGRQRLYFAPKGAQSKYLKQTRKETRNYSDVFGSSDNQPIRNFFGMEDNALDTTLYETFDFVSEETRGILSGGAFAESGGKDSDPEVNKPRTKGPKPTTNDSSEFNE